MGEIVLRHGTEWMDNFEHNGIDWLDVAQKKAKEHDIDLRPLYAFDTDTGDMWQVTPENCFVWMSDCDDLMDMVTIMDPRDQQNFVWYRAEIGEDRFEQIAGVVGMMATRIMRLYPGKGVQDMFEERATRDIEELDSFPDTWA